MAKADKFRFSIDRGGTFTDIYAEIPEPPGFKVVKLLSEDPDKYSDAPREGIRRILAESAAAKHPNSPIDPSRIDSIRMGTTVATNALLERQGVPCALLITKGFADLLEIGNQNRPRIFDLQIKKPQLLYKKVIEVDARLQIVPQPTAALAQNLVQGIDGQYFTIIRPLNHAKIRQDLRNLIASGITAIAVALIHSYSCAKHELAIGKIAKELGFTQISLSSQIMPMVKLVGRGDTAVVDAYLTPHIKNYIDTFRLGFIGNLDDINLLFMRSDGGLAPADNFTGSRAILSGPAGGVVGYAMTTIRTTSNQPVIGFDMGGTSTDVSRFDKNLALVQETETAGVRIQAPQLDIITVAAGGGSCLFFRNNMFEVGPESAGAHPGPVCYRKGGKLTITDANLVLGRLLPEHFPAIFGKNSDQQLDKTASLKAFAKLQSKINTARDKENKAAMTITEIASGFIDVANETMVRPMREISTARGFDVKDHILACFGGAGGQHACAIAKRLGVKRIFIHRFAGILSAYGMGLADVVEDIQEPAAQQLNEDNIPALCKRLDYLQARAQNKLTKQGIPERLIKCKKYLNLRFTGTDTTLMIEMPANLNFAAAFRARYRREFGFELTDRPILVNDIRVRAIGKSAHHKNINLAAKDKPTAPLNLTKCTFNLTSHTTPIYQIAELGPQEEINGPAIIIHATATILVEPNCRAQVTDSGDIDIEILSHTRKIFSQEADPIQLAIFSNLFMSIAEQMGRTLQRTAISTNIKERLDFSCAIFDSTGGLVANAPHQPVHLGAMGEAIRRQIELCGGNFREGDVLVTNHPVFGGSHLPDITVISPVMGKDKPLFFVANRGHHADIGGISPGSMPPFSTNLAQEGVCIKSFKLVDSGIFQEDGLRALLATTGKFKDQSIAGSRAIADNISDLKAQIAANHRGIELIADMIQRYQLPVVQAYMDHIQNNAESAVRRLLIDMARGREKTIEAEDYLDDGTRIHLALTIDIKSGDAIFDFTKSGDQVPGNTNTPRAVTASAILYTLRCMINQEIPLNQGCLKPIKIITRPGSILAPSPDAAVVGGNVLTSQRLVDVILKAFAAAAASQGCMNNFTFGNNEFGYYETIGGGAGAGPSWHGQSGVHTHMTNTRITDPEIIEKRYPVLMREFSIRQNSGGTGRFTGGNGLIREMEFLQPLNIAILSERRVFAPYGLAGGAPGKCGVNTLIRKNGEYLDLGGKNETKIEAGDRVRILTPGGGGYGMLS